MATEKLDELKEVQEIETLLNIIIGHLRNIRAQGNEELYQQINDYFFTKYGTVFCKGTAQKNP
ncbi:MAG: hypothetical protein HY580_00570 [Nitrospinae bacterium]|nr:hypothetical protein [Nitrospinota bacterium]